jgi:transcriptional regulator with XRE-family HTH domain
MEKHRGNKRILLGRRIRAIRKAKGWTQEQLGSRADITYKFIGEIELGKQNPSFETLVKIADALEIELSDLFRLEQGIINRKDIEAKLGKILKGISEDDLRKIFSLLRDLYPHI